MEVGRRRWKLAGTSPSRPETSASRERFASDLPPYDGLQRRLRALTDNLSSWPFMGEVAQGPRVRPGSQKNYLVRPWS
jgi:hypothetical protein